MDTVVEISIVSCDKKKALEAIDAAFVEISRLEKLFNRFDEESELTKLNRSAFKKGVVIRPELFGIIKDSIYYSEITNGSFDITARPFKRGEYKDIVLNEERLSVRYLSEDISIDLGGIAKGYAVDRAKNILLSCGIKNAMVDIGGNIYVLGSAPGKNGWIIGIQDPMEKGKIVRKLNLKNRAVSTSGNYERGAHIIDPATGNPIERMIGVTIVSNTAEEADALSTTVFVMGPEKGKEFIESLNNVEVYIY